MVHMLQPSMAIAFAVLMIMLAVLVMYLLPVDTRRLTFCYVWSFNRCQYVNNMKLFNAKLNI